jgi:hypothetical protein
MFSLRAARRSDMKKIKTEHSDAKNGGGFWGKRAEAKQRSKKSLCSLREGGLTVVSRLKDAVTLGAKTSLHPQPDHFRSACSEPYRPLFCFCVVI